MPESNSAKKEEVSPPQTEDKPEKVSLTEAFKISRWAISFIYNHYPVHKIFYIITNIINEFQSIIYSFIFAKILDVLVNTVTKENASIKDVYPYLLVMIIYSLVQTIVSYVSNWSRSTIRTRSWTFMRRERYVKLHSLGIQTLELPDVNNRVFRSEEYLQNVMPYFDESVSLIASIVNLITVITIVGTFLPTFTIIMVLVSLPYLFIDKNFRKKQYRFMLDNTEKNRVSGWIAGDLGSPKMLQEITVTNAFSWFNKKCSEFRDWMDTTRLNMQLNFTKISHFFAGIRDFVTIYGYIILFQKFFKGFLSIGKISFWMSTMGSLERALTQTTRLFNDLSEFSMQIKDVYLLFTTEPVFAEGNVEMPILKTGPSIEFKKVSFKYPNSDKFVIKDLDLNIKPGEKVAIVGHNGAGKTTLVKLISRFYSVTKGELNINNTNIKDIKSETLYRNLGVLSQEYNTYGELTVKENICIGRPEEEFDEIGMRTAAQTADAMGFIQEYPNKFDQILSERFKGGIRPSTGQWQKIAIARFFYRNSPLVIFDEPTASIDPVSEYTIFSQIYDFFEGKTVIIISHRFSTVRNADRIIVLDNGNIIEEGTHNNLMEIDGKYANGFKLQAEGYSEEGVKSIANNN